MLKIEQAQKILEKLGMPKEQQNEMAALTFLALCGIKKTDPWKNATRKSLTVTKSIMAFVLDNYGKKYAPNTRETFRRHVLHQFVQGRIADYNPDNPDMATNSPNAHYAISDVALKVTQTYGTKQFEAEVQKFKEDHASLSETYRKDRIKRIVPVTLPNGKTIELSPGRA